MVHGERLPGQDRRVVQGDVRNHGPEAYLLDVRCESREQRPSLEPRLVRIPGVSEMIGEPRAVEAELVKILPAFHQRGLKQFSK